MTEHQGATGRGASILGAIDGDLDRLVGDKTDPAGITNALQYAARAYHLISPSTTCGALPIGHAIRLDAVVIDVDEETYETDDEKRGLHRAALQRIASGVGLSWIGSTRLDDGANPWYWNIRADGVFRSFDGTIEARVGTDELDLRPGAPQRDLIVQRAIDKALKDALDARHAKVFRNADPYDVGRQRGENQVRAMAIKGYARCETTAQLRAIRSMGLRHSYTAAELRKPFVCARLIWTGRSDDPEIQRLLVEASVKRAMQGTALVYGDRPGAAVRATAPALQHAPAPAPATRDTLPPPREPSFTMPNLRATGLDPEHVAAGLQAAGRVLRGETEAKSMPVDTPAEVRDAPPERPAPPASARSGCQFAGQRFGGVAVRACAVDERRVPPDDACSACPANRNDAPTVAKSIEAHDPGSTLCPFGKGRGKRLDELATDQLAWLERAIAQSVDDPEKARFADRNRRMLADIRAVRARPAPGSLEALGLNVDEIPFG